MKEEEIKGNKFFNAAKNKARKLVKNKGRLQQLVKKASLKARDLNLKHLHTGQIKERLAVMFRMIKAYAQGNYREVKVENIIILVAAVIYFVSPIDLLPDFIPITGLVDDFTILVWVYSRMKEEIDNFLLWEQENENAG